MDSRLYTLRQAIQHPSQLQDWLQAWDHGLQAKAPLWFSSESHLICVPPSIPDDKVLWPLSNWKRWRWQHLQAQVEQRFSTRGTTVSKVSSADLGSVAEPVDDLGTLIVRPCVIALVDVKLICCRSTKYLSMPWLLLRHWQNNNEQIKLRRACLILTTVCAKLRN